MNNKKEEFENIGNKGINKSMFVDNGWDDLLTKGATEEELKKADVSNAFNNSYGDKQIKVGKTGKEIKVGLTAKKGTLSSKKQILEDKKVSIINDLQTLGCKDSPDQIPYQAKDADEDGVKIFSWQIREKYNVPYNVRTYMKVLAEKENGEDNESSKMMENVPTDKLPTSEELVKYKKYQSIEKKMGEFNDLTDVHFGVCRDLATIETMLNNFKDGTTYQLSVQQLQAAGL